MIRVCVDCGRQFEITPGEERFYKSKGLDLPKRCKPCRDKKRSLNNVKLYLNQNNTIKNKKCIVKENRNNILEIEKLKIKK